MNLMTVTIDVVLQPNIFRGKCSSSYALSRAINAPFFFEFCVGLLLRDQLINLFDLIFFERLSSRFEEQPLMSGASPKLDTEWKRLVLNYHCFSHFRF